MPRPVSQGSKFKGVNRGASSQRRLYGASGLIRPSSQLRACSSVPSGDRWRRSGCLRPPGSRASAPGVLYLVQDFPNVVQVRRKARSHIDRFGSKRLAGLRTIQSTQATPQGGIDCFLEGQFLFGPQGFELSSHIIIKAQRRSHTSLRNISDVLMSKVHDRDVGGSRALRNHAVTLQSDTGVRGRAASDQVEVEEDD